MLADGSAKLTDEASHTWIDENNTKHTARVTLPRGRQTKSEAASKIMHCAVDQ